MSIIYPTTLPLPEWDGFAIQAGKNKIQTEMQFGMIKQRRLYTSNKQSQIVKIQLDNTELQTFLTFYNTTLKNGTLPFTWIDFITEASKDYYINGGFSQNTIGPSLFEISFILEEV